MNASSTTTTIIASTGELPRLDPNNLPEGFHFWPVDKAMTSRIANMLEFDFAALGFLGVYVVCPLLKCHSCGKISGLDDFIFGALKLGVHKKRLYYQDPGRTEAKHGSRSQALIATPGQTNNSWFNAAKDLALHYLGLGNGGGRSAASVFWDPNHGWDRRASDVDGKWPADKLSGKAASVFWDPNHGWDRRVSDVDGKGQANKSSNKAASVFWDPNHGWDRRVSDVDGMWPADKLPVKAASVHWDPNHPWDMRASDVDAQWRAEGKAVTVY